MSTRKRRRALHCTARDCGVMMLNTSLFDCVYGAVAGARECAQKVEKQREEELQRARRVKEEVERQKEEARKKKARAEVHARAPATHCVD